MAKTRSKRVMRSDTKRAMMRSPRKRSKRSKSPKKKRSKSPKLRMPFYHAQSRTHPAMQMQLFPNPYLAYKGTR